MNQLKCGLDPQVDAFLKTMNSHGGRDIYELSVEDARSFTAAAQAKYASELPANVEDLWIPGGKCGEISVRIVRSEASSACLPVIMFFHGGGWVLGDQDTYDRLVREIAINTASAVVFVNYTRSPEARYPVAIEEAYAATKFISENGKAFHLDPTRLAVFGDSAGGNIAAAVTLLAKQRNGPKIDFQVLFYPVTDADFETESYREYARKLICAGVEVVAVRYLGTIHNFITLNALSKTAAARSAMSLAASTLRRVFDSAAT